MKVDIYNTDKKYNIIYADPPWTYKDKRNDYKMSGGAIKHYKTMKIEDIYKMGDTIQKIAAKDCMLFMWATFPNLVEALKTIKAWGFTYKTLGFSWIKTNKRDGKPFFGIGFYTKSNYVSSCIISKRREHSRKPDEARERITQLVGQVPKIELFARQETDGWDCWGNEL